MANLSNVNRKQQVLLALLDHANEWLLTTQIETAVVGGSSGTRRFRELRDAGWPVETRRHPDKHVDQWQYRIRVPAGMTVTEMVDRVLTKRPPNPAVVRASAVPPVSPIVPSAQARLTFGDPEVIRELRRAAAAPRRR